MFAGGFDLPAASAVCVPDPERRLDELEVLDVLDSLVRKSLLQVERSDHAVRYSLLETIRQFAEERRADRNEGQAVRDRHAAWFADRAEQAFADFRSPREALAHAFVDGEIANLRAAYNWARGRTDPEPAIRIAAIRANEDPRFEPFVWAYTDLAQVALFSGDPPGALALSHAGASHPVDAHDHFVLGFELAVRGWVGEPVVGLELDEAVARINERGVPMAVALGLGAQARALELAGEGEALVVAKLEQAIDLLVATGNRFLAETIRTRLLVRLAAAEDPRLALEGFTEIVTAWRENGDTAFAAARADLGPDRFDELAAEGSELSYRAAGDLALDRIRAALVNGWG